MVDNLGSLFEPKQFYDSMICNVLCVSLGRKYMGIFPQLGNSTFFTISALIWYVVFITNVYSFV